MQNLAQRTGAAALALVVLGAAAVAQCSAAPPVYSGPGDASPSAPSPTTPTSPSPTTPSGPAPTTPTGPRPGGPTTPRGRAGPTTPRGGIVIPMTRQSTSKSILGVEWDCPVVPKDDTDKNAHTIVATKKVLPVEDAFRLLAGDDPRPLLVLRECRWCRGTEHAVFDRRLNTEKTKLLLNWFHCVKMPAEVIQKGHPFYNLFANTGGKKKKAHLFISSADGQNLVEFSGEQPQSRMQKELTRLIGVSYQKNPKSAIKSMLRYLSEFDMLDLREGEMLKAIDLELERNGLHSSKHKKLAKKLAELRKRKKKAMKRARAVCDLKLVATK